MSGCADTARSLYLELRALRGEVWAEGDPDGDTLDFRIALGGLHCPSEIDAKSLVRRALKNEEGLVEIVLDGRDPDLKAIRREGHCR